MPKILSHRIRNRWVIKPGIAFFLAAITWLVFGQTLRHDFIDYDDPEYVYDNPNVTSGLTLHGVTWAFTHSHFNNWHPLTWLTHMLDWQLYERKRRRHVKFRLTSRCLSTFFIPELCKIITNLLLI